MYIVVIVINSRVIVVVIIGIKARIVVLIVTRNATPSQLSRQSLSYPSRNTKGKAKILSATQY